MSDLFFVILAILLVLYWFLVAARHPKGFPPGPRFSLPILGNALSIGSDLFEGTEKLRRKYGNVFGLYLGKDRTVVVSDYALIQEVGSSANYVNRQDFPAAAMLRGGVVKTGREITVPGIIFSSGQNWVEQRRFALHTLRDLGFGKNSMEHLVAEEVVEFCRYLERNGGSAVNISHDFNIAVLNSLWTILLNERFDYDDPKLKKLVLLIDQFFKEVINPLNLIVFMYKPLTYFVNKTKIITGPIALKRIINFIKDAVFDHERTFEEDCLRDFTDHYLREIREKSAHDVESSFKEDIGKLNLLNVLTDFFIAGSETTSTTLNWSMLYMIVNPDIQKKVQE